MKWITRDKKQAKRKQNKQINKPFKNRTEDHIQKRNSADYKKKRKIQEKEWLDY